MTAERSPASPEGGSLRRAVESHLGSRQVPRVIYGSIIGLALVLVLEDHLSTTREALRVLLSTALAVALAELYAEIIGAETRKRRHVTRSDVGPFVRDAGAVAFGAAAPAIFVVLSAIGLFDLDTGLTIAKWTGLALIGAYGYVGDRFAGGSVPSAFLHGLAVAAIGGLLIALKALVH
jgi:hypothetical protein